MNAHACLWCGGFDCPDRWEHERLWRRSEQYRRLPLVQAKACPGCSKPVDDGQTCAARPVDVPVGVAA